MEHMLIRFQRCPVLDFDKKRRPSTQLCMASCYLASIPAAGRPPNQAAICHHEKENFTLLIDFDSCGIDSQLSPFLLRSLPRRLLVVVIGGN